MPGSPSPCAAGPCWAGWALAVALAASAPPAAADPAVAVHVASLDRPGGTAVVLPGHWFAAPGTAIAPAMLLLHGCGGLFDGRGRLADRYTELAARLNTLGVHVLVTDSLGPRGEHELCTQAVGNRRVTQVQRRRDALGALAWLAAQPGVDVARLGLLGWSNGGSTVLAAINQRHPEVALAPVRPTLAVAYYPGCATELRRGHQATAPLLMLLGEADDWTPAAPCKALAAAADPALGPQPRWEAYAGAYHGFDGSAALRLRRDVPNGVNPGQGVHVGADPTARAASAQRLELFLRDTWSLTP